jgi:hypothetical protein
MKNLFLVMDILIGLVALASFTRALIAGSPPDPDIATRDKFIKLFAYCVLCGTVLAVLSVVLKVPTPFYPNP